MKSMTIHISLRQVSLVIALGVISLICCNSFAQSDPVGVWHFNENTGTTAYDDSGNDNDGTLTNTTAPWIDGKLLYGLILDGTNDYVSIPNDSTLQLTGDMSISFWIKPTNVGVETCNIIYKSYNGEFSILLGSNGKIYFMQGRSGAYFSAIPIAGVVNDEWQHIVLTRDMSSRKIKGYLNGQYQSFVTYPDDASYSPPLATTNPVKIGAGYTNDFNGEIDTVRIYDRVIEPHEVLTQSLEKDYIVHLRLDETSGTTAYDSTSLDNDGSYKNFTGSPWVTGIDDGALEFPGTNDYLKIASNSDLQLTGDMTIAFWIKPTNIGIESCNIIHKNFDGEFSIVLGSNGKIYFWQGTSVDNFAAITVYGIVNDEWQHIVLTRDITTREFKGYVNGQYISSVTYPDDDSYPPAGTTSQIKVGAGYTNDFNGKLDNLMISNRVFDKVEVLDIYQSGGLCGYWDMNEADGTVLTDISGHGNNGTLTNMITSPWVTGHIESDGYFRTALTFSGTDDHVSVPNDTSLQITGDLTLSLWIKPTNIGVESCSLIDKNYGGEFSLVLNSDGSVHLLQGKSQTSGEYFDATVIPASTIVNNEWQHILVTRDMTTRDIKGYVNGILEDTVVYTDNSNYSPPASTTSVVKIGDGYTNDFNGDIDKVKIYSRVITTGEMDLLFFNLLTAYFDRTYYTGENATAVCSMLPMAASELDGCYLVAKDSTGTTLDTNIYPETDKELTFSTSSLSNGNNTITIELRKDAGEKVFSYDLELVKKASSSGSEVKVDRKNRYVLKDGTPFFPIGMIMAGYSSDDTVEFQEVANAGFNTVLRWELYVDPTDATDYLENADDYGLMVIDRQGAYAGGLSGYRYLSTFWDEYLDVRDDIIDAVGYAKQESNLLAYYTIDEPDPNFEQQLDVLQDLYTRTNSEDGYHPVVVSFSGQMPTSPSIEEVASFNDVTGNHPYWHSPYDSNDESTSIDYYAKGVYGALELAKEAHRALWIMPAGEYVSSCVKRAMTAEEQRSQTYLALINGAKGIIYFRYPIYHDSMWSELEDLTEELDDLAPSMLEDDLEQTITYYEDSVEIDFDPSNDHFSDVQVSLRKAPSSASYDYVLLAANTRRYSVDVDYTVSLLGSSGTVSRLFDTGTFTVTDGEFSDTLGAYETRAYTFTSSSTDPITIGVDMDAGTPPAAESSAHPYSGRENCTNLMQNPSLEDNHITNWPDYCVPYYASPRINATNQGWGLVTTSPYHSNKCLEITKNSNELWNGFEFRLSPQHSDQNGKNYTFSIYMKADQAGRRVRVGNNQFSYNTETLTTSWARYTYTVNIPADAENIYLWYIRLIDDGTIWADAVQVEQASSASTFTTN